MVKDREAWRAALHGVTELDMTKQVKGNIKILFLMACLVIIYIKSTVYIFKYNLINFDIYTHESINPINVVNMCIISQGLLVPLFNFLFLVFPPHTFPSNCCDSCH